MRSSVVFARAFTFAAICFCATLLPSQSEARGFFYGSVNVGSPYYYAPAYGPAYYEPTYAYPAPAPYPYPAYYAYPAPATTTPPAYYQNAAQQYCREYTRPIKINGQTQQGQGEACLQPDGSWKIVN